MRPLLLLSLFLIGTLSLGVFFFMPEKLTAEQALDRGDHYFNVDGKGEYNLEKAEKYYAKALELDPNVPDAWHQLARIDFLSGNFGEALAKINTQIDLHGESSLSSYYVRGLIEGFNKDYQAAETDFKFFLSWKPESWAAHNDLAWIYFEQGKFADAEKTALKGLSYDPDNAWLLLMHGTALMNLGRREEAMNELLKAKEEASKLTATDWGYANPGNDPRVAKQGLLSMRQAIEQNLVLVQK